MNTELITKFRYKVNDSTIFRSFLMQQEPEHRPWNALCSAIDWIETAAVWLQQYHPCGFENDYLASMDFSFYLVAVDTILKGMEQLEHIFNAGEKELGITIDRDSIRKKREGVFLKLNGAKNNTEYFRNIRAIFFCTRS